MEYVRIICVDSDFLFILIVIFLLYNIVMLLNNSGARARFYVLQNKIGVQSNAGQLIIL